MCRFIVKLFGNVTPKRVFKIEPVDVKVCSKTNVPLFPNMIVKLRVSEREVYSPKAADN